MKKKKLKKVRGRAFLCGTEDSTSSCPRANPKQYFLGEKFFEDFPQADEETYLYACSQMLNYFSSYVDCLARQNYDGVMELFNQTLEDYGYEEKNWNKR